jgi:hypothetical protein
MVVSDRLAAMLNLEKSFQRKICFVVVSEKLAVMVALKLFISTGPPLRQPDKSDRRPEPIAPSCR